jgi:proteasome lid subunit RPN8/RPN11
MLSLMDTAPRRIRRQPRLIFSPLAWLKLQFFCHAGDTEIAGFAITAKENPLYVEEFVTVKQATSAVTVALDDAAIADYVDRSIDAGLSLQQVFRVWCHTHPGSSPDPSGTDEDTFARVFGSCDWAVMFILSRTSATYARLSFHVGPGATVNLPVAVDWTAWPEFLEGKSYSLDKLTVDWEAEFRANIHPTPFTPSAPSTSSGPSPTSPSAETGSPWETFAPGWDWSDLDQELLEEYERHVQTYGFEY